MAKVNEYIHSNRQGAYRIQVYRVASGLTVVVYEQLSADVIKPPPPRMAADVWQREGQPSHCIWIERHRQPEAERFNMVDFHRTRRGNFGPPALHPFSREWTEALVGERLA